MVYKWNIFLNNFDRSGGSSPIFQGIEFIEDQDGNATNPLVGTTATFISSSGNISAVVDSGTNEIDLNLSGTIQGSGTTVGAVTNDIINFALGSFVGVYQIEAKCMCFDQATPSGAGYNIFASVRSNGVNSFLIGQQAIFNENANLASADAFFVVSGNSIILRVLGVTALTLFWNAEIIIT